MNKRIIAAVLTATALAVPSAAIAGADRHDHKPAKELEKGKRKGKKAKKVMFVFKGTIAAPGTVEVRAGNAHVRKGGFVGEAVTFDFEHAKVVVADTNGDGKTDLEDVRDGDKVKVHARMLRGTRVAAAAAESEAGEPLVARKLIVKSTRPVEDAEPAPEIEEPAPVDETGPEVE